MRPSQRFLVPALLASTLLLGNSGLVWAQANKPKPKPAPPTKPVTKPADKLAPTAEAKNGRVWALLVGVSQYANPQITQLRYPAADATSIKEALLDAKLGGVPASHVKLLTNTEATRANILNAVDTFLKPGVQPGDRVIVFLAGHGIAKGVGTEAKSYLLPNDVAGFRKEQLEASAVNLRTLADKLSELPASQFVVLMDACREDPIPGRGVKGNTMTDVQNRAMQVVPRSLTTNTSSATFFACSVGQRAFEDPTLGHGVFTYNILKSVEEARAARPGTDEVDMGLVAAYVKKSVEAWAKKTSESGAFEVEQTPEFVSSLLTSPITLLRLPQAPTGAATTAAPPTLYIAADPPGADVQVNGRSVGTAPVMTTLNGSGDYKVSIVAPGYTTVEKTVKAFDGYGVQVDFALAPGGRSVGSGKALEMFQKGQAAEAREEWEVAAGSYDLAIEADSSFAPAYENLSDLQRRRSQDLDAIDTLAKYVQKGTPDARSYGLLSRTYALYSLRARLSEDNKDSGDEEKKDDKKKNPLGGLFGKKKGGGDDGKDNKDDEKLQGPARFVRPRSAIRAAILARYAAEEALKLDGTNPDALISRGFALLATETKDGKNRSDAEKSFGKAVALNDGNADAYFGLGYCIRSYAQRIKDSDKSERDAELDRAIKALDKAITLRPNFYDAHRELAFCHHLKGELKEAQKEYEQANANRGAASDENEVAAVNLALGAVLKARGASASGAEKEAFNLAAEGYFSDAKDITPNLEGALRILAGRSLAPRLTDYLPSSLRGPLDKIKGLGDGIIPGVNPFGGLRL